MLRGVYTTADALLLAEVAEAVGQLSGPPSPHRTSNPSTSAFVAISSPLSRNGRTSATIASQGSASTRSATAPRHVREESGSTPPPVRVNAAFSIGRLGDGQVGSPRYQARSWMSPALRPWAAQHRVQLAGQKGRAVVVVKP